MLTPCILVVDDEPLIRWSLAERLTQEDYRVIEAATGREALERAKEPVDLVLLDLQAARHRRPDAAQADQAARSRHARHPADRVRERRDRRRGDEAGRVPLRQQAVQPRRDDAGRAEGARDDAAAPRGADAATRCRRRSGSIERIVGESPTMRAVKALLAKVAGVSPASTVLLTGESGTGKDLAAKVIHYTQRAGRAAVREHHLLGAARDAARVASCSGTSAARSPTRGSRSGACSNRPTAARCSSTRSARWCRRCRPSCCASSRRRRSSAWAARRTSASTCASSPRPTGTSRTRCARAASARTCTTA